MSHNAKTILQKFFYLQTFYNLKILLNSYFLKVLFYKSNISIYFQWYIQATCATQGDGLYEGLDWLCNELAKTS